MAHSSTTLPWKSSQLWKSEHQEAWHDHSLIIPPLDDLKNLCERWKAPFILPFHFTPFIFPKFYL
jgi:hypothetical protein